MNASEEQRYIGVALSGGGHRAALFAMGVLMYLVDVGKNRNVAAISSVSGGSITNAYVGLEMEYGDPDLDSDTFLEGIRPCFDHIVRNARFGVKLWLLGFLLSIGIGVAAYLISDLWQVGVVAVTVYVLSTQAIARMMFTADLRRLLHLGRRRRDLADSNLSERKVDHVLCATDLADGQHFYLSGRFVHSDSSLGSGEARVDLVKAILASGAFPGVFGPVAVKTKRLGLGDPGHAQRKLHLVDGGVHDNLATSWLFDFGQRKDEFKDYPEMTDFIVVNSSTQRLLAMSPLIEWPVVGRLIAFGRSINTIHQSNTAARADAHETEFQLGRRRGAMISIDNIPHTLLEAVLDRADGPAVPPELKELAQNARNELANHKWATQRRLWEMTTKGEWVRTSLGRVKGFQASRLVWHAYVLAMINCHVLLGYPIKSIPELGPFQKKLLRE